MSPVFRCAQVCARLYATIPKHKSTYCNNRYFLYLLTRVPKALLTFPAGMHMKKKPSIYLGTKGTLHHRFISLKLFRLFTVCDFTSRDTSVPPASGQAITKPGTVYLH